MADFEAEFRDRLRSDLEIPASDAERIASQATKFRRDVGKNYGVEELIDRMKRRSQSDPVERWNAVVGYLYLASMPTDDDEGTKNPYQIR